jgi:hypothetical protein
VSNNAAAIRDHEDEQRDHDGKVGRGVASSPLARQDLDAFLKVDESDVETEDIAGETSYIFKAITGIGNGKNPVHDQRPATLTVSPVEPRLILKYTYMPIHAIKVK